MAEKKNVPEIRFKGFSEEWKEKPFNDTFSSISNNTLSRAELNYDSGLGKNVHYGDILIKFGELLNVEQDEIPFISNDNLVNKFKSSRLQNGDIILADAAEDETVGKCTEIRNLGDEIIISGLHTIPCRPTEPFAFGFLGYYMNSIAYHNQLLKLMQGTKVLSISKTAIKDTVINYPSESKEQSRIGTYFQNLDKLITLHQRKHDKLITLKKAMLEKMFPKDGADVPEIRFKGFDGKWEILMLNEVSDIIGGGTPSTMVSEYWNGNIDWYSPTEIGDEIYAMGSQRKITKLGLEKSSARILPANRTVLFTSRAGIGDMAILTKDGATNQGFQSLVIKGDNNPYFFLSIGHLIKKYALKNASGSTFLEISGKQLGNMDISVPVPAEQSRIGTYFQNLDNLISLHQKELEKLKNVKKGCLEKMFV